MRDQIQTLTEMVQNNTTADQIVTKPFVIMLLDVVTAQAVMIEALKKDVFRLQESMDAVARGAKPVSQHGVDKFSGPGGGSGFSIG